MLIYFVFKIIKKTLLTILRVVLSKFPQLILMKTKKMLSVRLSSELMKFKVRTVSPTSTVQVLPLISLDLLSRSGNLQLKPTLTLRPPMVTSFVSSLSVSLKEERTNSVRPLTLKLLKLSKSERRSSKLSLKKLLPVI